MLDAERFKASIANPKGNEQSSLNQVDLSHSISELISLLKDNGKDKVVENDNDDDFMHVTCHIDCNLKSKIGRGEFIELDRLLPKSRNQIMNPSNGSKFELIRKDGATFRLPEGGNGKDVKITGVRKWEQAFCVYAAVYSEVNPHRSAEIWQYVHIINTAAASYSWENVAFYDYTFRQLMERKPHRSWAKIYTQMWNLAMTDHISKSNNQNFNSYNNNNGKQNHNPQKNGDWRDKCCWRFNKGKCTKWNCRFEHRCNVRECGSYSHGAFQCSKKKKGSGKIESKN